MSRIGRKPIPIPEGVSLKKEGESVVVAGPKGQLTVRIPSQLTVEVDQQAAATVQRKAETTSARALHGLFASKLANAIFGVTNGWSKTLVLVGTGYRARVDGESLILSLGFSHPIKVDPPEGISFSVSENKVTVAGLDREIVGQVAASIRAARPPEPYKGKGVRYEDEYVRRKAGKSAKTQAKVA